MSLLLEALKKAELAKQNARADAPAPEPQPEPVRAEPVMTRERLPDISQPLEILTDDLPSSGQRPAPQPPSRTPLALQEPAAPASAPATPAEEVSRSGGRAQAEQLFRLNEMDYNPRRPFYLTLAVLVLVGAGYGGYVWWQLRPKSSFSAETLAARPAAAQTAAAPAAPGAIAMPAPGSTPVPAAAAGSANIAIPTVPPIRPAPRVAVQAPAPTPSGPAFLREPPFGESPAADAPRPPIAVRPASLSIDPLVEQGYDAYQKGDLAGARDSYLRLLAREPNNRDALLGLAAIDARSGRFDAAESRYVRLLELDPRDAQAVAGLAAIRAPIDPVASESRLKNLLASQPEASYLYFTLGNLYAQQSNWSEAQAAYFKAFAADPENADYAFNLAVSLDQLRQRKSALDYYQRALALADKRPGGFDRAQAQARVRELGR
jgi:hypothetical protein